MPETAGPWTFSPFSTGGDLQRKIKSQKPVDFSCFSLFSDLLFPLFFNSAESGAGRYTRRRRQAGRVDGRISNFPLPPSFLHRRCRPPLPRLGDRHPWVSVFCSLLLFFSLPSHFLIVSVMSCWRRDAAIGRLMVVGLGDTGADGGAGVLLWDWEKTGKRTTRAAAVFGLRWEE